MLWMEEVLHQLVDGKDICKDPIIPIFTMLNSVAEYLPPGAGFRFTTIQSMFTEQRREVISGTNEFDPNLPLTLGSGSLSPRETSSSYPLKISID